MKVAICLVFSIVLLVVASETAVEEREDFEVEETVREEKKCAYFKEPCTEGDDCSCCGDKGKCDCNWPGKPGCFCMKGMIATAMEKFFKCTIG